MRNLIIFLIIAAAAIAVRADDDNYYSDIIDGGDIDCENINEEKYSDEELKEMGLWDDEKNQCVPSCMLIIITLMTVILIIYKNYV